MYINYMHNNIALTKMTNRQMYRSSLLHKLMVFHLSMTDRSLVACGIGEWKMQANEQQFRLEEFNGYTASSLFQTAKKTVSFYHSSSVLLYTKILAKCSRKTLGKPQRFIKSTTPQGLLCFDTQPTHSFLADMQSFPCQPRPKAAPRILSRWLTPPYWPQCTTS